MNKPNTTKAAPKKVIVNFQSDVIERNEAALAVRRLGYLTLSQYLREKMREAIKQATSTSRSAA